MLLIDMLIALPLAGCIVTVFAGKNARWTAMFAALATAAVTVALAAEGVFQDGANGWDSAQQVIPHWALYIDGLSAPLVALTAFLGIVAILASWRIEDRPAAHHALLLGLVAAVMGVFLSEDIFLLYVFWEAVLIPMFFLIGVWGHENRKHAALKFFIYTFAGSAFMLVGILMLYIDGGSSSISDLASVGAGPSDTIFWLLAIGMLVKVPVVPLHTWLPDAHVEAPTAGSILLAGVLLKMGGYGLIRLVIPLVPTGFFGAQNFLAVLGVIGIVYGAAMALAQSDLKRLVAFSSVAHMGFVLLAIASGTAEGLQAAVLGMVSHGVVAALLFLLVGQLYERTHTRELSRFGGLGKTLPGWATALTFGALASLGLPGLSGFPGEFGAVIEGIGAFGWWVALAGLGVVLGGAYILRAVREVNHGPVNNEWDKLEDLTSLEWLPVGLLALAILILGVWPRLVTDIGTDVYQALAMLLGGGV